MSNRSTTRKKRRNYDSDRLAFVGEKLQHRSAAAASLRHDTIKATKLREFHIDPKSSSVSVSQRAPSWKTQVLIRKRISSNKSVTGSQKDREGTDEERKNSTTGFIWKEKVIEPPSRMFDELSGLDLSHLTPDERNAILKVAQRAKEVESSEKSRSNRKEESLRSTQSCNHAVEVGKSNKGNDQNIIEKERTKSSGEKSEGSVAASPKASNPITSMKKINAEGSSPLSRNNNQKEGIKSPVEDSVLHCVVCSKKLPGSGYEDHFRNNGIGSGSFGRSMVINWSKCCICQKAVCKCCSTQSQPTDNKTRRCNICRNIDKSIGHSDRGTKQRPIDKRNNQSSVGLLKSNEFSDRNKEISGNVDPISVSASSKSVSASPNIDTSQQLPAEKKTIGDVSEKSCSIGLQVGSRSRLNEEDQKDGTSSTISNTGKNMLPEEKERRKTSEDKTQPSQMQTLADVKPLLQPSSELIPTTNTSTDVNRKSPLKSEVSRVGGFPAQPYIKELKHVFDSCRKPTEKDNSSVERRGKAGEQSVPYTGGIVKSTKHFTQKLPEAQSSKNELVNHGEKKATGEPSRNSTVRFDSAEKISRAVTSSKVMTSSNVVTSSKVEKKASGEPSHNSTARFDSAEKISRAVMSSSSDVTATATEFDKGISKRADIHRESNVSAFKTDRSQKATSTTTSASSFHFPGVSSKSSSSSNKNEHSDQNSFTTCGTVSKHSTIGYNSAIAAQPEMPAPRLNGNEREDDKMSRSRHPSISSSVADSEGPAEWSVDEMDDGDTLFLVTSSESGQENLHPGITAPSNLRPTKQQQDSTSSTGLSTSYEDSFLFADEEKDTEGDFSFFEEERSLQEQQRHQQKGGLKRTSIFDNLSLESSKCDKIDDRNDRKTNRKIQQDLQSSTALQKATESSAAANSSASTTIDRTSSRNQPMAVGGSSRKQAESFIDPGIDFRKELDTTMNLNTGNSLSSGADGRIKLDEEASLIDPVFRPVPAKRNQRQRSSSASKPDFIEQKVSSRKEASLLNERAGLSRVLARDEDISKRKEQEKLRIKEDTRVSTADKNSRFITGGKKIFQAPSGAKLPISPLVKATPRRDKETRKNPRNVYPSLPVPSQTSGHVLAVCGKSYFRNTGSGSDSSDSEEEELFTATTSRPVHPEDMEESGSVSRTNKSNFFFRRTTSTDNFEDLLKTTRHPRRSTDARTSRNTGTVVAKTSKLRSDANGVGAQRPTNSKGYKNEKKNEIGVGKTRLPAHDFTSSNVNRATTDSYTAVEERAATRQGNYSKSDSRPELYPSLSPSPVKADLAVAVSFGSHRDLSSDAPTFGLTSLTRCVSCGMLPQSGGAMKPSTTISTATVVNTEPSSIVSKASVHSSTGGVRSVNSSTQVTPEKERPPFSVASIDLCQLTALIQALKGTEVVQGPSECAKSERASPLLQARSGSHSHSDSHSAPIQNSKPSNTFPIVKEPQTMKSLASYKVSTRDIATGTEMESDQRPVDRTMESAERFSKTTRRKSQVVVTDVGIGTDDHEYLPSDHKASLPRTIPASSSSLLRSSSTAPQNEDKFGIRNSSLQYGCNPAGQHFGLSEVGGLNPHPLTAPVIFHPMERIQHNASPLPLKDTSFYDRDSSFNDCQQQALYGDGFAHNHPQHQPQLSRFADETSLQRRYLSPSPIHQQNRPATFIQPTAYVGSGYPTGFGSGEIGTDLSMYEDRKREIFQDYYRPHQESWKMREAGFFPSTHDGRLLARSASVPVSVPIPQIRVNNHAVNPLTRNESFLQPAPQRPPFDRYQRPHSPGGSAFQSCRPADKSYLYTNPQSTVDAAPTKPQHASPTYQDYRFDSPSSKKYPLSMQAFQTDTSNTYAPLSNNPLPTSSRSSSLRDSTSFQYNARYSGRNYSLLPSAEQLEKREVTKGSLVASEARRLEQNMEDLEQEERDLNMKLWYLELGRGRSSSLNRFRGTNNFNSASPSSLKPKTERNLSNTARTSPRYNEFKTEKRENDWKTSTGSAPTHSAQPDQPPFYAPSGSSTPQAKSCSITNKTKKSSKSEKGTRKEWSSEAESFPLKSGPRPLGKASSQRSVYDSTAPPYRDYPDDKYDFEGSCSYSDTKPCNRDSRCCKASSKTRLAYRDKDHDFPPYSPRHQDSKHTPYYQNHDQQPNSKVNSHRFKSAESSEYQSQRQVSGDCRKCGLRQGNVNQCTFHSYYTTPDVVDSQWKKPRDSNSNNGIQMTSTNRSHSSSYNDKRSQQGTRRERITREDPGHQDEIYLSPNHSGSKNSNRFLSCCEPPTRERTKTRSSQHHIADNMHTNSNRMVARESSNKLVREEQAEVPPDSLFTGEQRTVVSDTEEYHLRRDSNADWFVKPSKQYHKERSTYAEFSDYNKK